MTVPRPRSTTSDLETKRAERKRDEKCDRRCERCDRPSAGSFGRSDWRLGMRCPRCQHENPAGQRFCGDCGTPLQLPGATAHRATSYADIQEFLTEARARESAIGEILRVIGSSPTDGQPVSDAIVRSASEFCDGADCIAVRFDGDLMHLMARHNPKPGTLESVAALFPRRPSRDGTATDRAILDGHMVHVPDILEDPTYDQRRARAAQLRSLLSVPLMRAGNVIGTISVSRAVPGLFSDRQIELLKTFADQAVIAIENVRLFNETKEALEQQTATAEILRVVSSSPTDVQPVYNSIVERAARLCDAEVSLVARLEGDWIHVGAVFGTSVAGTDAVRRTYPMRPGAAGATARAIRDSAIAHIPDVLTDQEFTIRDAALTAGFRAVLAVPMLREGRAIGAISIGRAEVGEFSTEQVNLLRTFADQAVIAIENVRLFKELQEKNRALTQAHAQVSESLEQQTATSEILRVISESPTDVQPVFETIVRNATKLCEGTFSAVFRWDGALLDFAAAHNWTKQAVEAMRAQYPIPATRATGSGRAILDRAVVQIADIEQDPEYRGTVALAVGFRSGLFVPMMREGTPVGAISVGRATTGPFSNSHVELLKTFADQAVIAIENVDRK